MPHFVVLLKSNYERSCTVITRFVSSGAEVLLPDSHEPHLRVRLFPQLYRNGTDSRIHDSKNKLFLQYGIAIVIYVLVGSSPSQPAVKFQCSGRRSSVHDGGRQEQD